MANFPTPTGLYLAWSDHFDVPVIFYTPDAAKAWLKSVGGGQYLVFHSSSSGPWTVKGDQDA